MALTITDHPTIRTWDEDAFGGLVAPPEAKQVDAQDGR